MRDRSGGAGRTTASTARWRVPPRTHSGLQPSVADQREVDAFSPMASGGCTASTAAPGQHARAQSSCRRMLARRDLALSRPEPPLDRPGGAQGAISAITPVNLADGRLRASVASSRLRSSATSRRRGAPMASDQRTADAAVGGSHQRHRGRDKHVTRAARRVTRNGRFEGQARDATSRRRPNVWRGRGALVPASPASVDPNLS